MQKKQKKFNCIFPRNITWEDGRISSRQFIRQTVETNRPTRGKKLVASSIKVRLMFLKHYTGLSDEVLVERINTDWSFQSDPSTKGTKLSALWRLSTYFSKIL